MNKSITTIIAVAVIVGGGAFYGGMKYTESNPPAGGRGEFSQADFSARGGQGFGANVGGVLGGAHEGGSGFSARGGSAFGGRGASRPLVGEVLSQTEDSLTIKLSDGSTKIIFVSGDTEITKSVDGTIDDLGEGEQIFVGGTENPDGSYTAQTIQLRPDANF